MLERVGVAVVAATIAVVAPAAELLSARVAGEDGDTISFRLIAENRDDVVGGTIEMGARSFTIARISLSGLIGASRSGTSGAGPRFAEFAVFSSSFSKQTVVGQPWVSAREYIGCDSAYNSFLAIYRIAGENVIAELGPTPYARLSEDVTSSQSSQVYCFVSTPPADG